MTDGHLSDAQLESVVLAGEAHSRHLAADYRIGAGWETVQRCPEDGGDDDGSADAIDVTADGEVLSAPVRFRRGWMLGDGTGAGKGRQGAEIPLAEGILFSTYATLRSPARQGKVSRLDQIVAWLAGSLDEDDRHAFDGAVVFDEAHAMANAAGSKGTRRSWLRDVPNDPLSYLFGV